MNQNKKIIIDDQSLKNFSFLENFGNNYGLQLIEESSKKSFINLFDPRTQTKIHLSKNNNHETFFFHIIFELPKEISLFGELIEKTFLSLEKNKNEESMITAVHVNDFPYVEVLSHLISTPNGIEDRTTWVYLHQILLIQKIQLSSLWKKENIEYLFNEVFPKFREMILSEAK